MLVITNERTSDCLRGINIMFAESGLEVQGELWGVFERPESLHCRRASQNIIHDRSIELINLERKSNRMPPYRIKAAANTVRSRRDDATQNLRPALGT